VTPSHPMNHAAPSSSRSNRSAGTRTGVMAAVAGTAVLVVAELLSIPIAGQRMDETGPGLVGACFGVGTIVSAVGFLVAGVATVAAGAGTGGADSPRWPPGSGWRP
jgi:uncharacterized membrane protein YhiD involved in acid resistance